MHVHLDPLGGIAGDMFIAAMLDAWPEWQADLFDALALVLPPGWQPRLSERRQQSIVGRHFSLSPGLQPRQRDEQEEERAHGHDHDAHGRDRDHDRQAHGHGPADRGPDSGSFRAIRARLADSALDAAVKHHAIGIFGLLAQAESAIHGIPVEQVHFHELADWDSIADIVGAAWLIDRSAARAWSVGPLPLGSGMVRTAHGRLPVPAPATARLLEGFDCVDDGLPGERVTPTGAAILRYLEAGPRAGVAGRMQRSGYGMGTRELADRANALRVLVLETPAGPSDARAGTDQVLVLEFAIDDQSAEDLAVALEHLRELPQVLDVSQSAAVGKKGRLVQEIQVLCTPEALPQVSRRAFEETTTIGLRWRLEQRLVLPRTHVTRQGLRVKRVERPGGTTTAKAEIDDVTSRRSHAERALLRQQAEQAGKVDDE